MAVIKTNTTSSMTMIYLMGQDLNGKNILKRKSHRNLKPQATDQNIFDLSSIIDGLTDDPLLEVTRTDGATLIQE